MRFSKLSLVFTLAGVVAGEVLPLAASGNHAPRLSHPAGLTVNRPSLGAQSLKMPPGYLPPVVAAAVSSGNVPNSAVPNRDASRPPINSLYRGGAANSIQVANVRLAAPSNRVPSPNQVANRVASPNQVASPSLSHAPLLHHPQGLTANRPSLGALSLAMPHGYIAPHSTPAPLASTHFLRKSRTTRHRKSWLADLFNKKQEGPKAPERVSAWDIDLAKTAVKKETRLPAPQHAGALFVNGSMPIELRQERTSSEAGVSKFLKMLHIM
eukprot:Gregarina_sp_Pseudo_9__946@NODE_1604_length_1462_cov_227_212930_g1488_i0_p1_GENE_NODE_1604_length_1462_cov_227_212930_g1488_i0NODE_1604_length_1462_cov_227_212930_g1488_i0_p1_ORF_typecomplete_len314_score63_62_NODE_1604_length_1462_cov_227_212930_g1488_i0140943